MTNSYDHLRGTEEDISQNVRDETNNVDVSGINAAYPAIVKPSGFISSMSNDMLRDRQRKARIIDGNPSHR